LAQVVRDLEEVFRGTHVRHRTNVALNLEKLSREWRRYRTAWLRGDNTATHVSGRWVNRWVESARASAYIAGHLEAFLYPLGAMFGLAAIIFAILWRF
jgi:hypothetical protein